MDRRQRKTREAIFSALAELLNKKTYNNITVQDIIDVADIGRSTFYSHFETKDDLLRDMCKDVFDHVFSEELKKEDTHDFSRKEKNLKDNLTHILYHLSESKKNIRAILSCESSDLFMEYFKKLLYGEFEEYSKCFDTDLPVEYVMSFMVSSFADTVRWWLRAKDNYTPEQMAEYYVKMLSIKI